MLDLPEIAENGNAVKVAFDIDSPMTADNYVKAVHILADGNPEPDVATFNFSPAMGALCHYPNAPLKNPERSCNCRV